MRNAVFLAGLLLGGMALAGCAYVDAKADLMSGGPQSREAAASRQLEATRQRNQAMQDELSANDRDVERNQRKLAALQDDLTRLQAQLDRTEKSRRANAAAVTKLKAELAQLQRDTSDLDLQVSADGLAGKADTAARRQQVGELERKKAQLERVLADMAR